ncbi:hypothetical protein [Wenzhouxiangella marina]|uniref:hypothetical protein n=1 Tax=Wenzhouxiangella marina TaxID=1579979 RepID=UPI0012E2F792|nr:hypothetical protein [Wenzhouxiangella marina]MBB6087281.1 hypothetical protein [Wenzhouxiangella marina]
MFIGALGLISLALARPIFCDRFEAESCLVLPRVTLSATELSTFESGELTIGLEKGALPGGQDVFLVSSDPAILALPASVRMDEGETELTLPISTQADFGSVTLEATAADHQPATLEYAVTPRGLTFLSGSRVEVGHSIEASIELDRPAPQGGTVVSLSSVDASVIELAPSQLTIPAGGSQATVTLTGVGEGSVDVRASAPGYTDGTLSITGIGDILSIGQVTNLVPGQERSLPISLRAPAPAGGLTVQFESADPGVASVDPVVEIPAGSRLPTIQPRVRGHALGDTVISARVAGFATRQRDVEVAAIQVDLGDESLELPTGWAQTRVLTLSTGAPAGGLEIALSSSDGSVLTVPQFVSIPAGQVTATFQVSAINPGTAELTAQGDGIGSTSLTFTVGALPSISLEDKLVGRGLQDYHRVRLTRSPPAPVEVFLTVDDPSVAVLTRDRESVGASSISMEPSTTSSDRSYVIQGLSLGTTLLTASAEGFADAQAIITVTPAGLYLDFGSSLESIVTTVISDPRRLYLEPARLNQDGSWAEDQSIRAGLDLAVPVSSDDSTVGSVTPDPVLIEGGRSLGQTQFTATGVGATMINLDQPAGFQAPTDRPVSGEARVYYPHHVGDVKVGQGLQLGQRLVASTFLFQRPVTLSVSDPTIALISDSGSRPGVAALTLNPDPSQSGTTVFIQGLSTGTTTLTSSTPGFPSVQSTITVLESGFYIRSPFSIYTTTVSPPTGVVVGSRCAAPEFSNCIFQGVRPGLTVEVPVTTTNPAVGELDEAVVVFEGGVSSAAEYVWFQPEQVGVSELHLLQPSGFLEDPGSTTSIDVTVNAPQMSLDDWRVGKDLQTAHFLRLGAIPTRVEDITVHVADPSLALLSKNIETPGSAVIELNSAGNSDLRKFYVQGLQQGVTEIIASGPSYAEVRANLTVTDSGFFISGPEAISATLGAGIRQLAITSASLNEDGTVFGSQRVRSGLEVEVPVTVDNPLVGEITASPITFPASFESTERTGFNPLNLGVTAINIEQPDGFTAPIDKPQSIEARVGTPAVVLGDASTGYRLQDTHRVSLEQLPIEPIDIELSVSDPSVALLSDDPLAPGAASLTLGDVGSDDYQTFSIQGVSEGTTTLTARASGFEDVQALLTVNPSGFIFTTNRPSSISPLSATFPVGVNTVEIDGQIVRLLELNPEQVVSVPISNSDSAVGQITVNPVVFESGDGGIQATGFDPMRVGTTTLGIGEVSGFSEAPFWQTDDIEVQAPQLELADLTVGKNLQAYHQLRPTYAPDQPIDVLIAVANPAIARVAAEGDQSGAATVVLSDVQGFGSRSFVVQGLSQGTTTITASADGHEPVQATLTVVGSGFYIERPSSIETTHFSEPTQIRIRAGMVAPHGAVTQVQELRAGLTAQVPVAIADASVGYLTTNLVTFQGGAGSSRTLDFVPSSIGATTVTMAQPGGFLAPNNRRQSIDVLVQAAPIEIANLAVGESLQERHRVRLGLQPSTPVDISLVVDDPSIARLAPDANSAGSGAITLPSVSSTNWRNFHVQGHGEGSTTIRVLAAGYFEAEAIVTVTESGFYIDWPFAISTTTVSNPNSLVIASARLSEDGRFAEDQELRAGLTLGVPVRTDDSAVGFITTSPVQFEGGMDGASTHFAPAGLGATVIRLDQPHGFTAPSNRNTSIEAEVRAPEITFNSTIEVGRNLQSEYGFKLSIEPPEAVDVTLSVQDFGIAMLSRDRASFASPSLVIDDVSDTWTRSFWVHGFTEGETVLMISAPGYETVQAAISVSDSGFYIASPASISTTTFSSPSTIIVTSARLDEDGSPASSQPLRSGMTVEVPVVSLDSTVGSVDQSPVVFQGGAASSQLTYFVPAGVGATTISMSQPVGFSLPVGGQQTLSAAVRDPVIQLPEIVVGRHLQDYFGFSLEEPPPEVTDLQLSVADPTIALLSDGFFTVGSGTLIVEDVGGWSSNRYYVQGVEAGSTTITAAADGYVTAVGNLTVTESGFYIDWPSSITTSTISAPSNLRVHLAERRADGGWGRGRALRPGVSAEVEISTEDPLVGQLSVSPLVFDSGQENGAGTAFIPGMAGSTVISLLQPAGFTSPNGLNETIDATVQIPRIELSDISIGDTEQGYFLVRLAADPPGVVDLTLTVANPSVALLSRSQSDIGSSGIVIPNVFSTGPRGFYVHGLSPGTTTITASAPGYEPTQVSLTVTAAGL